MNTFAKIAYVYDFCKGPAVSVRTEFSVPYIVSDSQHQY